MWRERIEIMRREYLFAYTEHKLQKGQAVALNENGKIHPLVDTSYLPDDYGPEAKEMIIPFTNFKPTTYRSEEYKDFVRKHNCLACSGGPTVPHHVDLGAAGVGKKAPDTHCLPLCVPCHDKLHTGGEKTFWGKNNIDPQREIIRLLTGFLEQKQP